MVSFIRLRSTAVQVAVSVSGNCLVALGQREDSLRFVARFQGLALEAFGSLQNDPFDRVLLEHRMCNRADGDSDVAAVDRDDRNVFSVAASVLPGMSSLIFSPQHITGTPLFSMKVMMLPQCLQI